MTKKKHDVKTFNDVRRSIRTLWGAISTFQDQLYSIVGDIAETQSLVRDTMAELVELIKLTKEIKKLNNGENNEVLEIIDDFKKYNKEVGKIER